MTKTLRLYQVSLRQNSGYVYKCGEQVLDEDHLVLAHTPLHAKLLLRRKLELPAELVQHATVREFQLPTTPTVLASAYEGAQYYDEERRHYSQTYSTTVHLPTVSTDSHDWLERSPTAMSVREYRWWLLAKADAEKRRLLYGT
ncbi:MAG: hypothetical protein WAX89_00930 [Alphaproteobacteria bacterium]